MENLSSVKKSDVLPEFQAFLLAKKLAANKNVFFYGLRVSNYFSFAREKATARKRLPGNHRHRVYRNA